MGSIEHGDVKFFNPAADKRFGFVLTQNGDEIFFHLGDYRGVELSPSLEVEWNDRLDEETKINPRLPQRGERIVLSRREGRRGKGPKAMPWGFADEFDRLTKLAGQIKSASAPWAAPEFLAVKGRSTSGWFPTTYFAYYPRLNAVPAPAAGVTVKKFDALLVYKTGEAVVTGRTVRSGKDGVMEIDTDYSKKPNEPVHGIIPANAPDGFYFWSDKEWKTCEQVLVRVTSVTVSGKTVPAYYSFVSLRTIKSRQLVPNPEKLITEQEFLTLRYGDGLLPTDANLPVVETAVSKSGWWSTEEHWKWTEPDFTEGVAPFFEPYLDRIEEAVVTKQRVNRYWDGKWSTECSVKVEISGLEPVEIGFREKTRGGKNSDPSPAVALMRTPNRTYWARGSEYRPDSYSKPHYVVQPDPRLAKLAALVAKALWVLGPVEEEVWRETGGTHNVRYVDSAGCEIRCGHGWNVGGSGGGLHGENYLQYPPPVIYWPSACPFGCQRHEGAMDTPMMYITESAAKAIGVEDGLHPSSVLGVPCDVLESFRTRDAGLSSGHGLQINRDPRYEDGWHATRDGRYVAVGSFGNFQLVYLGADPKETRKRANGNWPLGPNEQTGEERQLTAALRRLKLIR